MPNGWTTKISAGTAALLATMLVACDTPPSVEAARNESRTDASEPPGNLVTAPNMIETSNPEIANTPAQSGIESRAGAMATPQERAPGSVGGAGAPDTSGRAHHERPKER